MVVSAERKTKEVRREEILDAALTVRMGGDPITRAQNAEDVPVQAALALLLRERLTGQPVPAAAREGVDMLRGWIEDKAGEDFAALAGSIVVGSVAVSFAVWVSPPPLTVAVLISVDGALARNGKRLVNATTIAMASSGKRMLAGSSNPNAEQR